MRQALALVGEPLVDEPARFLQSARPLVWVACFGADDARELARRLVDAHFDVRVLGDREPGDEFRTAPDLAIFDGDRASPHDWTVALRAHRRGTRVIACFDDTPAIWFIRCFTVLDGGPSQTRIVDAVIHQSRWAVESVVGGGTPWIA